jgi:hypothetical protein
MWTRYHTPALTLALLFAPAVAGCGSAGGGGRDDAYEAEVRGTVTLDGTPLEMGMVKFEGEGGATGMATIREDGTFVSAGKVPSGKVRVAVQTSHLAGIVKAAGGGARGGAVKAKGGPPIAIPPGTFRPVPRKYEDPNTSGLVFELKRGSNAPLTIELTSK